ncbi:hypothetical protein LINPERPRIM_LOCUS19335 [Linum perenne]
MSRITKWKLEKTKVKVVFRLQFHATHIPQSGWDKLFISFIPADSGKVTAKTTKANVRNGSCKWADPIYETTRLLQDVKTKRYDEKLYKAVVSMGSSRSSILGEAAINLSDYAEALKPSAITLPLHGCDSGTTLHVTVQLLTSKTGFREFEQQRELREKGLPADQSSPDESQGRKVSSSEEVLGDKMDKGNSRVRSKQKFKDFSSVEDMGENEEFAESALRNDGSTNTSESIYTEKHDISNTLEIESLKSTVSGDLAGNLGQTPQPGKGDASDAILLAKGTSDWVHCWCSDYSADNDIAASCEENSRLRESLEISESSILELKQEVSFLQSNAHEIGCETEKFSKQLANEIASGEDLSKEVSALKSECSKLKGDIEHLRLSRLCRPVRELETMQRGQNQMPLDLQRSWMNGILAVEDKIKELQGKACFGYQEMDARILHSDLETVLCTLQNLRVETEQAVCSRKMVTSRGPGLKEIREMGSHKDGLSASGSEFDVDSYDPELGILHFLGSPSVTAHEHSSEGTDTTMKGKMFEILRELDESKAERENLAKKMDQMEGYYEALVQELEENQRQMVTELQSLRSDHSTCLYSISSTKAEMETLHQDLNSQILRLSEDKQHLESQNKELEKRAYSVEAALKRARLNYSIAVGQLQKDLELLSFQVSSMFETNENLIRQAFSDSLQSSFQDVLDMEHSQKLKSGIVSTEHLKLHNKSIGAKKQQLGGDLLLDDLQRSLHAQEGLYLKVEEDVCEMHFVNIYLDVFSKTLQETLFDAGDDVKHMKQKLDELTKQLESLADSKELLMRKLQTALNDVHSLTEEKNTCVTRSNDMKLQHQILEASFQNITEENNILTQRISESESLLMQYSSRDAQYEACAAEKMELELLFEKKTLESVDLTNQIFCLQEELKTFRALLDELTFTNGDLEKSVNLVQDRLHSSLVSSQKVVNGMLQMGEVDEDLRSMDLSTILMRVEEFQTNACKQIIQLMTENKDLMRDRDVATAFCTEAKSEFECGQRKMTEKLSVSNALVQKLQSRVDAVAKTFQFSSAVEEKYALLFSSIVSELDNFELELQALASKNDDLARGILTLDTLTDELETAHLKAAELAEENNLLVVSLQDRNMDYEKLSCEMRNLKESLQFIREENEALIASSHEKTSASQKLASDLNTLVDQLQSLRNENQLLKESLSDKTVEAARFASEGNSMNETLSFLRDENQAFVRSLQEKTEECGLLLLEIKSMNGSIQTLQDENKALLVCSQEKTEESSKLSAELGTLKESLQWMHDESQSLMACSRERGDGETDPLVQINKLKEIVTFLRDENRVLKESSLKKSEDSTKLDLELSSLRESLQSLRNENETVMKVLLEKDGELLTLTSEIDSLKNALQAVKNELDEEKSSRDGFETKITNLTSELSDTQSQLFTCKQYESELVNAMQLVSDFEADKSRMCGKLLHYEEYINQIGRALQAMLNDLLEEKSLKDECHSKSRDLTCKLNEKECQLFQSKQCDSELVNVDQSVSKIEENTKLCTKLLHYEEPTSDAREESRTVFCLEPQLSEMHEQVIAAHLGFIFIKTQYENKVKELGQELNSLDRHFSELQMRHTGLETIIDQSSSTEVESAKIDMPLASLDSSRSDIGACISDNMLIEAAKRAEAFELGEYSRMNHNAETSRCEEKDQHSHEIERLKCLLVCSEGEIDKLMLAKVELEIKVMVLEAKFNEQRGIITSQHGCSDELTVLQKQCNELTQKLSEQVLKTEEFRNLSVHFRELKDKAESELVRAQARDARGSEGSSLRMQESLRIAFIKEQYETKLQDLKQQLTISKKHSDEMLWKLQDAIDDIENRKKTEVHYLKKNEELGMKMLELESELQSLLSDKRERMNDYDLMKAEWECSLISLECCKEEKQKLEASLRQCEEEKSNITDELILVKGLLENSIMTTVIKGEENEESSTLDCRSPDVLCGRNVEHWKPGAGNVDADGHLEQTISNDRNVSEQASTGSVDGFDHPTPANAESNKDNDLARNDVNGQECTEIENQETHLPDDMKNLTLINDHFRAESLRSSMDHLTNELERMKNENSFLQDDSIVEQKFPDLHRELERLQKANEELAKMFPSFKEFSTNGNSSLERVLALEMELAEALQVKKNKGRSISFQSSFLKQHSDDEAVFKSFKDINDLIKDTLETKGRYTALESELREMHNRYSELSLQFAEVEGERQKLMMTLKNVRANKKMPTTASFLNRSLSGSIVDHSCD